MSTSVVMGPCSLSTRASAVAWMVKSRFGYRWMNALSYAETIKTIMEHRCSAPATISTGNRACAYCTLEVIRIRQN